MSIRVTNIQRMCFDDGPGIRTTVFLKGCSIHCPWCSNPENISFDRQGFGIDYLAEELVDILLKDKNFWGYDGGVTFSGGESLMQADQLKDVWRMLKTEDIHLVVETALFVPEVMVHIAMEYIDFYYVDVKILEKEKCASVLGGRIEEYMKNVELLERNRKDIHFRVPCSIEYVICEENQEHLCNFLKKYKQYPVEIFALHDLGRKKYKTLGIEMKEFQKVPKNELEIFRNRLTDEGCRVKIMEI